MSELVKNPSVKTLEILQGISQVLARKHDGAIDEEFKPIKIGLRREEETHHTQRRMIDGFGASVAGNKLIIKYQSEIKLKEVHSKGFENEIYSKLEEIVSWIKKEYKKIAKESLGLKMEDEPEILVEHMNKIRTWVTARCVYKIEGIDDPHNMKGTAEERLKKNFENWMKQSEKGKK